MRYMNKETIEKAYSRLFPDEGSDYEFGLRFSRKFGSYNANARKSGNKILFSFSPEWKKVSEEISIGLVQDLLRKMLGKKKAATTNVQLYEIFIKNLHLAAAKVNADEKLLQIFNMVNEKYFNNLVELPNLQWSGSSKTKLATYNYHTDTISVSTIFADAGDDIIGYLLYHEMLHKKLKFSSGSRRTVHHSPEFRALERQFENREIMEKKLQEHARGKKRIHFSWLERLM
jgi:predicted metal-dependent hydrolase